MAGIGFRLQKLLKSESYSDLIKAYFYSSLISTGPMLVIMVTLFVLRSVVFSQFGLEDSNFFMGIIVYIYAFSLVGCSPFLYVVTRYLADKHYSKQMESYTPTYLAVLEVIFAFQTVLAVLFLYTLPVSITIKWLILCLYLFVNGIWVAMIFLSAGRSYMWIVMAFNAGAVVGIGAALFFGYRTGLEGFLLGFGIGQGITFFILSLRIFLEFGFEEPHDFGFLLYFKRYPALVLVGLCYYLGIWADKFIFWTSPDAQTMAPGIRMFPLYDTPIFIAYLTIIPSMAFFLIQMETTFSRHYQAYYQSIRNRENLDRVREKKKAIINNLSTNFQVFALFQGIISSLVILFLMDLAELGNLNPMQMGILRIGILGAFLQMAFLMIIIVLFYFDFQKEVLQLTLLFFLCNGVFTFITTRIGLPAYGFGYAGACLVAVAAGFLILDRRLRYLNYWTYMMQPVLIPKFKLENETAK